MSTVLCVQSIDVCINDEAEKNSMVVYFDVPEFKLGALARAPEEFGSELQFVLHICTQLIDLLATICRALWGSTHATL